MRSSDRCIIVATTIGLCITGLARTAASVPPAADVRVWDVGTDVGGDPTEIVVDAIGVSSMVDTPAEPLTNVTAFADLIGGPTLSDGLVYWNPATDDFCWFGWSGGGGARAVALAPFGVAEKTSTVSGFPVRTFRAGDVWTVNWLAAGDQLAVHFRGTGSGVCKGTDPADLAEIRTYGPLGPAGSALAPFDVAVDPVDYFVWLTTSEDPASGEASIRRLDPATNDVVSWVIPVSGTPFDLALDLDRYPMFTLWSDTEPDHVMHLDPDTDTFTQWEIPADGLGPSGLVSGGATITDDGLFVFAETGSGDVGVLRTGLGEICEIGGGADVRMVASTGSRWGSANDLQVFATEAGSNTITLITSDELIPACQSCPRVDPTTAVVTPTSMTVSISELAMVPTLTTITPVDVMLVGDECAPGTGDVACEPGESVSGVMRYDMSPAGVLEPAGVTGIAQRSDGSNVIFGTAEGSGHVFEYSNCALGAIIDPCGDGILDPGEECDDGDREPGDGCRADCTIESCGDGIEDPGEECDDGNPFPGDGCRADCTEEACGDGIEDPGEDCDDGNTDPGDGCSAGCTVEECGNGILDPGEECDDGNDRPFDGCAADCTLEIMSPAPHLLRNDAITRLDPITPTLDTIFTGRACSTTATLDVADPADCSSFAFGEGPLPSDVGSPDKDDLYVYGVGPAEPDPEAGLVSDISRPLILYQKTFVVTYTLWLTKCGSTVCIFF